MEKEKIGITILGYKIYVMSPKEPSTTQKPLAAYKERILSKGYICTEIQNAHQVICIYKATTLTRVKNTPAHVVQN